MIIENFTTKDWQQFVEDYFSVGEKESVRIVLNSRKFDLHSNMQQAIIGAFIDKKVEYDKVKSYYVTILATDLDAEIKLEDKNVSEQNMYRKTLLKIVQKNHSKQAQALLEKFSQDEKQNCL